jgi:hypothetical protein
MRIPCIAKAIISYLQHRWGMKETGNLLYDN